MLHRTCAVLLLLALSGRIAVSLYACHDAGLNVASEHSQAAVQAGHANTHGGHAQAREPGAHERRHDHRHHPAECPHGRGAAAIHPCQADPAAGIELASDAGPPLNAVSFSAAPAVPTVEGLAAAMAPEGPALSTTFPPPRTS